MLQFYVLLGLIDGAGPVAVEPPPVVTAKAGGGGGKAFRVKNNRQASPYRDVRETAEALESRVSLKGSESQDISPDIPAPVEARKPAPRQADRPDRLRDILSDIRAQEAAQGALAEAMRGVESQLRAAIAAQDMDEDEAVALILILAEA